LMMQRSSTAIDITERKKTEKELRANQEKLRLLASQMSLIEEKERRRIAIELHDSIGQSLALAKLKFTIEDDGIGFDTSRIVGTESFGIFR